MLLAQHCQITARRLATILGLTERLIYSILADLEAEGYLSKQRVGRCNHYQVHVEKLLPRSVFPDVTVGEMLQGMRVVPGEETEASTPPSPNSRAGTKWDPDALAETLERNRQQGKEVRALARNLYQESRKMRARSSGVRAELARLRGHAG